jgi:hypothetical protein
MWSPRDLTEAQIADYANAIYEVEGDDGWVEASAVDCDRDDLPATLISACNPWSQPLPETENARRHQDLRGQIESSRCAWRAARGRSPDSSWIEPGFLVQAPIDLVDVWARAWQQHAVLVLRGAGQAPTLRLYSPFAGTESPQQLANMRLEWVGCAPPASP